MLVRSIAAKVPAVLAALAVASAPVAADVTAPGAVTGVLLDKSGGDVVVSWDPLSANADGTGEIIRRYKVYRGATPTFPIGNLNLVGIGLPGSEQLTDTGAVGAVDDYYYLIAALDNAGLEGDARASHLTSPPVLSGVTTATSLDVGWAAAQPADQVASYRVYYGRYDDPLQYETVVDVGLLQVHTITGLAADRFYYVAVTALDLDGNESAFSNRFVGTFGNSGTFGALGGRKMCWPAGNCPPVAGVVQRSNGQEINAPIDWPEGNWVKAEMVFTTYSNALLDTGCVWPDGGGDIFDRLANTYLVLDESCLSTGNCYADSDNLELIHAVTPFGTDAITGPRVLTFDITPFVPLLTGRRWVGVNIDTFDANGWFADVAFVLSAAPAEASPKPPAAGVQVIQYHEGGNVTEPVSVSIPATATSVKMRFFSTGHGAEGPANCDEFCQKDQRILVDGVPVFEDVVWRDDCSPGPTCDTWNACGFPSCTFARAGWCPGYIACHDPDAPGNPCDQDLDATAWLPPGETHDVLLQIDNVEGYWSKSLVVYWYE